MTTQKPPQLPSYARNWAHYDQIIENMRSRVAQAPPLPPQLRLLLQPHSDTETASDPAA